MEWFSPNLNADELKKEYRKLCRQYHPDVSKDPDAEEKMKEINYQFDKYYAHQVRFEYTWASEARARQEAHKVRKAELVRMYWNKDFGHYTTRLLYRGSYSGYMGYMEDYIVGHAIDEPDEYTWDDFKGGLAYVGYEWGSDYAYGRGVDEINCKRLPAEIVPATPEEIYWYNKDHWLDTETDVFLQADCKFGRVIFYITGSNVDKIQFYAKNDQERYARVYGNMMMKCTLPDEFLIGNKDPNTNAEYEARSIQMVNVRIGSCGTLRNVVSLTGEDFPYMVYQQCTVVEFMKYHDMFLPQFADITPMHKVPVGMLMGERDPIVDYLHRKGILEVWRYNQNFRVCCGCFNKRMLEQNMELTSIEDVELAQDYLDIINANFVESAKTLLKRNKITMKI